jgi:hypothetical protein
MDKGEEMEEKMIGGRKDDSGKTRFDLMSVDAINGLAEVLTLGGKKYGDRNWQAGLNFGRLYRAALGHLFSFWQNDDVDKESTKLAIDHAQCCLHFLSHYLHNYSSYKEFDDRKNCRGE